MLARPLTDLLKKDTFLWSTKAEATFSILKTTMETMATMPVFLVSDFKKLLVIEHVHLARV